MIIKINETRKHEVQNQTVNGLNISALLESAAVNTVVPPTGYNTAVGFDPSQINVEVVLLRTNAQGERSLHTIMNANLAILGQYNTILQNGNHWRHGLILQKRTSGATQIVTRGLFVYFGGHINVKGDDLLTVTVTVNRGTFGSAVSAPNSTLQVEMSSSIGIETALHRFHYYAIQASQNQDTVSLGDNVMRCALLSFATDPEKPVFRSCSFASDRLDWTANEQELITRHLNQFPFNYCDVLLDDVAENAPKLAFPHTRLIHFGEEVDQARVNFTMVPANVLQSENFVAYTSYITSLEIVKKAADLKSKHDAQDQGKLKVSI